MKRNGLMSGALILSIGSVLAKVFSAVYRIGLTRILGGEGIGLYQLVFPLYSLCVVLATAGLPMAISKIISRHPGNETSVVKKCVMWTSIISLSLALILILCSGGLAHIQGQKDIAICYVILAPTIIIVSATSVLRGYFQGKHNFMPSSISNIAEQFVKLCIGLILSLALVNISIIAAIIGAVVSIVISEIISFVIMLLYYKKHKKPSGESVTLSVKDMFKDILPITLTNVIMPVAAFIDSLMVVNLLSISFTKGMSIFLYGLESGAVASLVSLPTIFSFAIASVILPNLVGKASEFNKSQKLTMAVKIILIITLPCVLCFTFIPDRLIELLYADRLNGLGVHGLNIAYRLLVISGLGIIFLAVNQVYSSSLQAVDKRYVTIRNLTIGVVIKFVLEIIFMPSVKVNIYALAIANSVCYLTAFVLNHLEVRQHFTISLDHIYWGKLIIANSVMMIALMAMLSLNNGSVNTLLSIAIAGCVYLATLFMLKLFSKQDKAMMKYKMK